MASAITHVKNPFASGSYKKVYDVEPATPGSKIVFNNIDADVEKIISKTLVYHKDHRAQQKKTKFANALCELEMQQMFFGVELAPRIYAIQFEKVATSELYVYYINATTTVASVYAHMLEHLNLVNDSLIMYVLTTSCVKEGFEHIIETNPDYAKILQRIDTFIQKLVYHGYWFLDFKPANMCIMSDPLRIIGLDFDKKFIIDISQINRKQFSVETLSRVARTYMFALSVLFILDYHIGSEEDADTIRELVRTRHLKAADMSEMFRVIIELERDGHNLCENKYNPLAMLTFYTLHILNIPNKDVLPCSDINKPTNVVFFQNRTAPKKILHEYIKNVLVNNVIGIDTYNAEKTGINFMTNPYVSVEFNSYKERIPQLLEKPTIPFTPETVIMPMFMTTAPAQIVPSSSPSSPSSSSSLPPTKKYKPAGGKKRRKSIRKNLRNKYK